MFSIIHSWTHFTMARGGNSLTAVQSAERGGKKASTHCSSCVTSVKCGFFFLFFLFLKKIYFKCVLTIEGHGVYTLANRWQFTCRFCIKVCPFLYNLVFIYREV